MTLGLNRIGRKAAAAVLVLGLAAGYASAQNTNGDPGPFSGRPGRGRGPGGPGGPGGGGPMGLLGPLGPFGGGRLASQLELTDAQKGQIQSIAQSHTDEWKAVFDRERQAREALRTAIEATPFDEITIRQKSAEVAAVDADVAVARARARGELLQVLTAAQQAKLKELQTRRPGKRG